MQKAQKRMVQLIESTNGAIFTATFVKLDGTTRVMNARLGVKKHRSILNTQSNVDRSKLEQDYITVYDLKAKGYRNINRHTLKAVRFGGVEIKAY
jgi:WYL_2, Sm-like SH3 beta-barrel fold